MKISYSKSGNIFYGWYEYGGWSGIPIGGIVAAGEGRFFTTDCGSMGRFLVGIDFHAHVFMKLADAKKALKGALRAGYPVCRFPALQSSGHLYISPQEDSWVYLRNIAPELLLSTAVDRV